MIDRPVALPPDRTHPPSGGDRLAVVVGNATLLGIGYLFLRRWVLAACAVAGTGVAVVGIALTPGEPWWLVVLGLWWVAMVVHAWILADAAAGPPAGPVPWQPVAPAGPVLWQRIAAASVVVILLSTVLVLRADAQGLVRDAGRSHAAGDCTTASATLDRLHPGHTVVAETAVLDGRAALEACGVLLDALGQRDPAAAAERLQVYLDHPAAAWEGAGPERAERLLAAGNLKSGFGQLRTTLSDVPGQSAAVRQVVETFLAELGDRKSPCEALRTDEWVHDRTGDPPELAEPIAADADQVPERVLACAREQAQADRLTEASATYEQFLDRFGDHKMVRTARSEQYDVDTAVQRVDALAALNGNTYCKDPVPYRGAPAYAGSDPHKAWWFGIPEHRTLPSGWEARDIDEAELVVCLHDVGRGRYLETCRYTADDTVLTARFHAWKFRIAAYSLRTGKAVERYTQEIGDPCPMYYFFDAGDNTPTVTSGADDKSFWSMFDRFQ
ncbi:hypothetical protein [Promicromonospora sp. NPDC060271]|uniref:hypothetical protein n=1 Tax=Promicromonospora sp. NPDC060271 TaxID=3347089 RepID=UPI0036630502